MDQGLETATNRFAVTEVEDVLPGSRWRLVRSIGMFQLKLLADGFRDLVLSPLSIVAGVLGILVGGRNPDVFFRQLQLVGRQTDRWIDLFDAYRIEKSQASGASFDAVADKIEEMIRADMARGGVTKRTREAIAELLSRVGASGRHRGRDTSRARP